MWDRLGSKDTAAPLSVVLRETINGLQLGELYPEAYGAVIDHDFRAAAAAIQCPALVFAGTLDPLFSQLDAAYEQLQQGSKAIIDGAKTYVCETHTDEVAQLLRDFFPQELT